MSLRVIQKCLTLAEESKAKVASTEIEEESKREEKEVEDSIKEKLPSIGLKRKAMVRFSPAKKPIYLGIFANDPDSAKKEQKNFVQNNLRTLFEKFGDKIIQQNSQELLNVFKFPPSHHITTYFVKRQEGEFYENFEEGLSIPIEAFAMAYVPNQIICGICLPDPSIIEIENPIPHITLFVGTLAPRFSNNVLQTLFINQPTHEAPLGNLLKTNKLVDPNKEIFEKFNLPIAELPGKHDIYFIKPKHSVLRLPATTRAFFGNTPSHSKK